MSRTKRQEPRNGQFKKLKASKQKRNKKQRQVKANLSKHMEFASNHREHLDITSGYSASMYMEGNDK